MKRGGKMLCSVAVLAIAACASNQGKLEIRPTSPPMSAAAKPVPLRIAEARGQLRLGNVALALESFRKAAREDPTSSDALAGIAACYDRMGRFDLSRRHYEAALAIAPGDVQLLEELANSLALQGRASEAASVRSEIAARLTAPGATPEAAPPLAAEMPISPDAPREHASAATIAQPVVRTEATVGHSVTMALPPVREQDAAATGTPSVGPSASVRGASVTITLPPPRPISDASVQNAETSLSARSARRTNGASQRPRIERLSMGEVALITAAEPLWRSQSATGDRNATARFVPLRPSVESADVRLLNAARVNRLAARTRAYLAGRGWRSISIGDADAVRRRSVILYPAGQREVARRLSAQFGFSIAPADEVRQVTVLLGRDSIGLAGARAGA